MSVTRKSTPLGRKVKTRLIELNMKQIELCERIGCHPSYLTMILDGSRSGEKYLPAIRKELGLPHDATLDNAE